MMLPLHIVTIALDAEPWIERHYDELAKLNVPWTWAIAEGVSANVRDTAWMKAQLPRFSRDGTTEYIDRLAKADSRVLVERRKLWLGKTAQINACLEKAKAPCIVLQMDADELWRADQLELIAELFTARLTIAYMQFRCRYFLGKRIIASRHGSYGNRGTEWLRAWRMVNDSQRFVTHEPPNFAGNHGQMLSRDETEKLGLVFDHHAYATESQVAYKQEVYRYPNAVDGWRRLQANAVWPTKLKQFLPWVDDGAEADVVQ